MENVGSVPSSESSWIRGKCVGKGSFGSVHLAVAKFDDRVFAVKSVDRNNCLPSQVESIENEIRILRSLSSPYVVNYLGDDVTEESPSTSHRNLHLEYLPGGTVADVADGFGGKYGDVDEGVVRSYTWCILSALRYLHAKSIAHCDVKGRNILVGHAPGTCKLADFGSAMEISGRLREKTLIVPRGSPLWMAPEVVRREYQGPESDVWSLGCTVIEIISGKPAWKDEGVDTLSRIGFSDDLPEFPSQLSELGRDFLSKCLRRKPSERWSCDQLLQHPFVSPFSTNTVTDYSPRCVLDWIGTEFSDEESDLDLGSNNSNSSIELREISARGRISELASSTGAIWESDGWTVVRDWGCDDRGEDGGDEGGGSSSEYSDTTPKPTRETERTSWEYLKKLGGIELVVRSYCYGTSDGGFVGCRSIAGSSCQEIIVFYNWCKLLILFLLFHLVTIIFIFNWLNSLILLHLILESLIKKDSVATQICLVAIYNML